MFCQTNCGFDFETFIFGSRRRGRGRRAKWKIFERGDLKFVILSLVSEQPMHGYEVMKALEDEGYVASEEQNGKKVYSITQEGRAYLEENGDLIDDVFERVEHFTDRFFGRDMKELSRSFSRLAQLTVDQAFNWGTGPEDLERMNEILEQAVHEMKEVRQEARDRRRSGSHRKAGEARGQGSRKGGSGASAGEAQGDDQE